MFGLRLELAGALIDVGLSGADGTELDDLGTVLLRDIGYRNRVFMDIQTNIECARLLHG